jgi:N-acylneuraminate cytidylyltransferase
MMNEQRIVAVIPARGGSTSVPKKNLQSLGGRPLVAWSIEVAQAVNAIDRVVVSTDDEAIATVAREYGAETADRPDELATDDALVIDALRYHLAAWRAEGTPVDVVVMLEPTCPLRTEDDVQACLRRLAAGDVDSVATFTEAALNPRRAWRVRDTGTRKTVEPFIEGAVPWTPRQQLPDAYQLNGGAYAFFADRLPDDSIAPLFGRTGAVYMPEERSVDIDSRMDLELANFLAEKRHVPE